MKERKYDDNITLVEDGRKTDRKLKRNEYYVLMVTDDYNKFKRNSNDYWDFELSWLGLERTHPSGVYISKDFSKRDDRGRGITLVAKVKNKKLCCELNY